MFMDRIRVDVSKWTLKTSNLNGNRRRRGQAFNGQQLPRAICGEPRTKAAPSRWRRYLHSCKNVVSHHTIFRTSLSNNDFTSHFVFYTGEVKLIYQFADDASCWWKCKWLSREHVFIIFNVPKLSLELILLLSYITTPMPQRIQICLGLKGIQNKILVAST